MSSNTPYLGINIEEAQAAQMRNLETLSRIQLFDCDIFGMKLLVDNFATRMRKNIYNLPSAQFNKVLNGLRNSHKTHIPKEYHGEVILMTEYNCYNRFKCPVEDAMLDNVIGAIVEELINEEYHV